MSTTPAEHLQAVEINRAFATYMARHGLLSPPDRVVAVQPPVNDDDETDCWTHAWEYVKAHPGALYVEGVCRRYGRRGIAPHAWVIENSPFGPRVVELTAGYENAFDYRGFVVDHGAPALAHLVFGEDFPRPSMIQLVTAATGTSIADSVRLLTL